MADESGIIYPYICKTRTSFPSGKHHGQHWLQIV